jgi:hypothetical protein
MNTSRSAIVPLILLGLMLLVALLQPLSFLSGWLGEGWGDLINGGVALALLVASGIAALAIKRKSSRPEAGQS